MKLNVKDEEIFAATGGVDFDSSAPTVVFLHGSGLDHRSWALQARWFAFHGYSVLAPDFPGHSLSGGKPLGSIEEMGQWLVEFLDETGAQSVHLVGHSQGFLVALEAAGRLGNRLQSITAIATAAAIPVNAALVETAQKAKGQAIDMMLQWGFGQRTQMGQSAIPGMQPIAIGWQIMSANPLASDLVACSTYEAGSERAKEIRCPAHIILATEDRMVTKKAGMALAEELGVTPIFIEGAGHMLPIEAPDACLKELIHFIQSIGDSE